MLYFVWDVSLIYHNRMVNVQNRHQIRQFCTKDFGGNARNIQISCITDFEVCVFIINTFNSTNVLSIRLFVGCLLFTWAIMTYFSFTPTVSFSNKANLFICISMIDTCSWLVTERGDEMKRDINTELDSIAIFADTYIFKCGYEEL